MGHFLSFTKSSRHTNQQKEIHTHKREEKRIDRKCEKKERKKSPCLKQPPHLLSAVCWDFNYHKIEHIPRSCSSSPGVVVVEVLVL